MNEQELQEKANSVLKSILFRIRKAATAQTEVSEEKKLESIELLVKQALRDLGAEK